MLKTLKTFALLSALVLLAACGATGPKYAEHERTVSPIPQDHGRIYIYRNSYLGAAVQPEVKLNGEVVGTAVPNGFFYVDRPAGKYEILTSTEVNRKLSLTLDKGQTRYVRLAISIGFFVGHVYPELVEPGVGAKEIQETAYSGGPK
jgi:predicted small lipoprotein YifL